MVSAIGRQLLDATGERARPDNSRRCTCNIQENGLSVQAFITEKTIDIQPRKLLFWVYCPLHWQGDAPVDLGQHLVVLPALIGWAMQPWSIFGCIACLYWLGDALHPQWVRQDRTVTSMFRQNCTAVSLHQDRLGAL